MLNYRTVLGGYVRLDPDRYHLALGGASLRDSIFLRREQDQQIGDDVAAPGTEGGRRKRRHARLGRPLRMVGFFGALSLALVVTLLAVAFGTGANPRAVPRPAALASDAAKIPESLAIATVPSQVVTTSASGTKSSAARHSTAPTSTKSAAVTPVNSASSSGSLMTGDSKTHCITPDFPDGTISPTILDGISSSTGVTYNCLSVFNSPVSTWAVWETPWMFEWAYQGWDAWLASSPAHQVIMSMDLIPTAASTGDDPTAWEQACDSGEYDQYATTLAKNLVSYGAGRIVIRLGPEANGSWEADYVGTTSAEMSDWAQCFDNEVAAMRAVPGTNFLFVWNPNVCTANIPMSMWYPGNSYVDIIGVDAYDTDCNSLQTVAQEGWTAYSTDSSSSGSSSPDFPSLANIEAFAVAKGKPMSFPEWGINSGTDDSAYVTGLTQMVKADNFAFECYFDTGNDSVTQLGSSLPAATAAYAQAFG